MFDDFSSALYGSILLETSKALKLPLVRNDSIYFLYSGSFYCSGSQTNDLSGSLADRRSPEAIRYAFAFGPRLILMLFDEEAESKLPMMTYHPLELYVNQTTLQLVMVMSKPTGPYAHTYDLNHPQTDIMAIVFDIVRHLEELCKTD